MTKPCDYIVGWEWYYNRKTKHWDHVPLRCGKIPAQDDLLCPKHRLLLSEQESEIKRKMKKLADAKAKRKLLRDMLPDSPLRAINPLFDEQKTTGYEERGRAK